MGPLTRPELPSLVPETAVEQRARSALVSLWEQFKEAFGQQVSVLEDAAMTSLTGHVDLPLQARAHAEAHKLAGSLGTFGLPKGSELARLIESWFDESKGSPPAPDPAALLRLSDAVVALRLCVEAGPPPRPLAGPNRGESGGPFLLLVDDDALVAEGLSHDAPMRKLSLKVVDTVGDARAVLAVRRPEAVLLDVLTGSGAEEAFEFMQELHAAMPPIPVVVLTRAGGFTDRVEAARFGGRGFIQKPIRPSEVLDVVIGILDQTRPQETVLAVDDDPAVLAALRAILEPGGKRVVALGEPLRFWETLAETSPDLLMLDVDMPDVNGVELCQVVRADPQWQRLPVLFLTARADSATVQAIFAAGADDYITKPVMGPELTTRIANRLERSRLLRRLAEVDTLTGLANLRTSADAATRYLDMAERSGLPMVAAMLDVDHLKAINDRSGYETGDEVLSRLGQLLVRSFASDDVVGRWGGEEFLVAMHGMSRSDGVQRLAEVLEEYRALSFDDGQGGSFRATFSAGVAQYPEDGTDLRSLYRSADRALGRAKEAGGDRVVPVGWSTHDDDDSTTADVVLAEDDEALAGILLHALATRGYRTRWFDDGADAALALEGPHPQISTRVMLLDWGLPSLDGLRVLRRLAETGGLRRTRVIMLTARDSESEILQSLDLGAFDHVAKPFSVPVLMKRVRRALEI